MRAAVAERSLSPPWLGASEMARRIRALDWSATPLGPLAAWTPSLRTSVAMCLHSRFPMAIYWGRELTYLYNDANSQVIGQLHPKALGRPAHEMLPEAWPVIGPRLRAVLERGEASWAVDEKLVFRFRERPEAGYFTYSYSPIHTEDGRIGGVLLVGQDTTARVLAERRTELLRRLAGAGDDATTVEEASEAMVAVLHGSPDLPFVAIGLTDGAARRWVTASSAITPTLDGTPPTNVVPAVTLLRGAGLPQWAVAVPFEGGVLLTALDDERVYDRDYRTLLERIAAQIAENLVAVRLHEGLRRHAEEIEALDAAKTTFFSNASHELRAPLSLVLGALEQANERSPSEWLDVARRNALRILRIVNQLLDYARLETRVDTTAFRPADLGDLTGRLVAMFESAAELAGLELINECRALGGSVAIDAEAWETVIGNLLSNALKFTPEGRITVRAALDGGAVVVTVADTGVGIATEHLEHVFSRFHRLSHPRARSHDGTGIGLALVREIVHLHGGTIEAESELGRGTRMVVRIPRGHEQSVAQPLADDGPASRVGSVAALFVEDAVGWFGSANPVPRADDWLAAVTTGEAPARVLVVDDNADMRSYLAQVLAPYFGVNAVPDGEAALAAAVADPPDVLVSDVMMPGRDGLELVRALRANARTREVPIVLLSARGGSDRLEALRLGADDYLLKPITARELVARVRATVQLVRVRREVAETRARLEERSGVERDLRAAHRRVVSAADAERRRIERNLHDGAQQRLIAILLRLEATADDELEPIRDELARALEELRELAHGLFPPLLTSDGLEPALAAAARDAGLPVTMNARAIGRFDPEIEAAVYFSCVEALQNAAKHAGPGARVSIQLSRTPSALEFAVRDDGVGCAPDRALSGHGLTNVRDRLQALGGTAEFESAPGRGTAVRGRIPLDA